MRVERSIVIERPVGEVFEFVADPRNDPRWCPKVDSVEQVEGEHPGPGSRYVTVHRPVPLRPARAIDHRCVGWTPPRSIEWTQDDGVDRFEVAYELEPRADGTRLSQRSDARLGVPKLLHPIWRRGIERDIDRQLRTLKELLEPAS